MRGPRYKIVMDSDDDSALYVAVVKKNGIEVHRVGANVKEDAVRAAKKWVDADMGLSKEGGS